MWFRIRRFFLDKREKSMIPKVIHYCWFGNGEMPEKDKKNIEGWKKINPDYQIMRWDESNYDVNKNAYMSECYSIPKWGFVPDYARTDIIYHYGGFYFDTDVELKKPLDSLLNEKCVMGFEKTDSVNHGHGFAAEKENPIIKELLDYYDGIKIKLYFAFIYRTVVVENHHFNSTCPQLTHNLSNSNGFIFLFHPHFSAILATHQTL